MAVFEYNDRGQYGFCVFFPLQVSRAVNFVIGISIIGLQRHYSNKFTRLFVSEDIHPNIQFRFFFSTQSHSSYIFFFILLPKEVFLSHPYDTSSHVPDAFKRHLSKHAISIFLFFSTQSHNLSGIFLFIFFPKRGCFLFKKKTRFFLISLISKNNFQFCYIIVSLHFALYFVLTWNKTN